MPNFDLPPPLPCYNPDLYASFEACNHKPLKCIARTAKMKRCGYRISTGDRDKGSKLLRQACSLPDSDERDELIADFVHLHCCPEQHRWRLEADNEGCWDKIVKNYSLHIGMAQHMPTPERTITQIPIFRETQGAYRPAGTVPIAPRGLIPQTSMRMTLRPGTTTGSAVPRRYRAPLDYFIPFKPDPKESILGRLVQDLGKDWTEKGKIYSYRWPDHPDFVKIGFTTWSALGRVQGQLCCIPGAILSQSVFIEHPKRIERLIHLELGQYRYRIAKCKTCTHSHEEWFNLSVEKVKHVMSDWQQVMRREALYDEGRKLTRKWRDRLSKLKGDLTARKLLDMLDLEEQSIQEPTQEVTEITKAISRVNLCGGVTDSPGHGVSPNTMPMAVSGRIHDLHSALTLTHKTGFVLRGSPPASTQLGTKSTKMLGRDGIAVDATTSQGVIDGIGMRNTGNRAPNTSIVPYSGNAQIDARDTLQQHSMSSMNSRKIAGTALMQDSERRAMFTFNSQPKALPDRMALTAFNGMASRPAQSSSRSKVIQSSVNHFEWRPELRDRRPYDPEASRGCVHGTPAQVKRKPVALYVTGSIADDSTCARATSTTRSMSRSLQQVSTAAADVSQPQDAGTSSLEETMLSLSLNQRKTATDAALWPVSTVSVSPISKQSTNSAEQGRITRSIHRAINQS